LSVKNVPFGRYIKQCAERHTMNTLQNAKIGTKISAGYIAVLVLLVVVGSIGWWSITTLTFKYESLAADNLDGAVYLANAESALWQLRYGFPQFLVVGLEERAKIVADEAKWYQQIDENMTAYAAGSRTPEELEAYKAFQEIYTKYTQARPRWFQLLNEGKSEEAAAWQAQTTTPFGRRTVEALDNLIDLQRKVAAEKEYDATATATTSIWVMIGTTVVALVIGLILTGVLVASFNQMTANLHQLINTQAREHEHLATILATMHDGILILDTDNQVTLANRAAAEVLALAKQAPFPIDDLAVGPAILDAVQATRVPPGGNTTGLIDELTPAPGRSLRAIATHLGDHTDAQTLVLLQDLSELRRAERSRRMLLTNITHDLRTPLASLQALLDALVDGAIDDREAAGDFLERMDVEVQSLRHLADEFLELSRIELGQLLMRRSPADLSELLHMVAARMEAQAGQRGVPIAVETADPLPQVDIDRSRIEQVVLNLLQNALTYTPAGGRISVSARACDSEVVVAVQDTGIGIEADHLLHIFERFYKADPSRSDGGVGLGLAIVKHLIEHHNGRIWAESTPGRGTTITFALPTGAAS
jgi:signal transduction histidine kinase/CHASE3 domain sensor protein